MKFGAGIFTSQVFSIVPGAVPGGLNLLKMPEGKRRVFRSVMKDHLTHWLTISLQKGY